MEKLRQIFHAANEHRLPIVVHLWVPDQNYGRAHSVAFLEQILPAAPAVIVQIAHFAGGGSGYVDEAIARLRRRSLRVIDGRAMSTLMSRLLPTAADLRPSSNGLRLVCARSALAASCSAVTWRRRRPGGQGRRSG